MILSAEIKNKINILYAEGHGMASIAVALKLPHSWVMKYVKTNLDSRSRDESIRVKKWNEQPLLK